MDVAIPSRTNTQTSPPLRTPHDQLGETDFARLLAGRPDKTSFIDKSLMIKAFLEEEASRRVLVTAPRRFGKTINLSMLRHFLQFQFEKNCYSTWNFTVYAQHTPNYNMFRKYNLKIMKETDLVKEHFGRYPVISLSFKCESSIKSHLEALKFCANVIKDAYRRYLYLMCGETLGPEGAANCQWWCNLTASTLTEDDKVRVLYGVRDLAKYLSKFFRQSVVLLVDDYDNLILQAMRSSLTRAELSNIIQDNMAILKYAMNLDNCVKYAFIMGMLHVADMSPFNIEPCIFLGNHPFVEFFGLTEEEAECLLTETYELQRAHIQVARQRYGGYEGLNGRKMYNMWSLLQFGKDPSGVTDTWKDTGSIMGFQRALNHPQMNKYIRHMLLNVSALTVIPQKVMMIDEIVQLSDLLREDMSEKDLKCSPCVFVSFLLAQGYLTLVNGQKYMVKIHNEEVGIALHETIWNFLAKDCSQTYESIIHLNNLFRKMLEGTFNQDNMPKFGDNLTTLIRSQSKLYSTLDLRFFLNMVSYDLGFRSGHSHFYKVENKETMSVDHVLVNGNCAVLFMFTVNTRRNLGELFKNHRREFVRDNITHYMLLAIDCDYAHSMSMIQFSVFGAVLGL